MKSVKPGRGPSKMGAVGAVAAALFGVFWCVLAGWMGAWFMLPFGVIFIGMAVYIAVYNHHNATAEDRYSVVDIVDASEESDPLNEKYGKAPVDRSARAANEAAAYCPYCGAPVDSDFRFCPGCGKELSKLS